MSSRFFFYVSVLVSFTLAVFAAGLYSASSQNFVYRFVARVKHDLESVWAESSNLMRQEPTYWIVEKRYDGNGVVVNTLSENSDDLVLLQGFFGENLEVRLIERDGRIVARWPVSYLALAKDFTHIENTPATDWNVGFMGSDILPDGAIIVNLAHVGVFKLDRCANSVWRVPQPTHHSLERNADGSYWTPSAIVVDPHRNATKSLFRKPFAADTLLLISGNGEIIEEISLLDVFLKSKAYALLTLTGGTGPGTMYGTRIDTDQELFHLNDVEELSSEMAEAFPQFEAGDLLVSIRNRNMVLVVDRLTHTIKWWQIGPWLRQHDPDWSADGTIRVFDNFRDGTSDGSVLGGSRIVAIDPQTRETHTVYGHTTGEFFYSERRGSHQILADQSTLVVEAEAGRVFQVNGDRVINWQYVNEYSATHNARITDAQVYSREYFKVSDWSCTQ